MKSFTESHKPIHTVLSEHIKTEDPFVLRKNPPSCESLEQENYKPLKEINEDNAKEIIIQETKIPQPAINVIKKGQFREALAIWLQFWKRSALYLCIISFIVGSSLSLAYFYKIEINLDKLLTVYIGCSIALWFFLTPIALYRSLKKVLKI